MTILLVLIPIGIVLLIVAVVAFVWAVRSGQFEDLEGEGERILFDDEPLASRRPRRGRDSIEGRADEFD